LISNFKFQISNFLLVFQTTFDFGIWLDEPKENLKFFWFAKIQKKIKKLKINPSN